MRIVFSILLVLVCLSLTAQTNGECELLKMLIVDIFLQSQDSVNAGSGTAKKVFNRASNQTLVIQNTTVANMHSLKPEDFRSFKENVFNTLDSSTFSDFLKNVSLVSKIDSLQIKNKKINLKYIDSASLEKIIKKESWLKFHKIYSNTAQLLQFSRAGFNTTKTQALIYYSSSSCEICGAGYLCLYESKNGKWLLVEKFMEWIS